MARVPARKSGNEKHQSQWLQATLSDVDEKMKALFNLLEDGHTPLQSAEIQETRKEEVIKTVQDLCVSYRSLAEKYDQLKSASQEALSSGPSSPSNRTSWFNHRKHKEVSVSWDDSQLEANDSNPESTVEDADIHEYDGITPEIDHLKMFDHIHNLVPNSWLEGEKFRMLRLVEENTLLQVELIRRNTEKRETIRKLEKQVDRLVSENNALQHRLSYYDRNKHPIEVHSPRKTALIDKFFRCS